MIQVHPPTSAQYDIAATVLDETVEIPPQQSFKSAQSTAVSYKESLRNPLITGSDQLDQQISYGGTYTPVSLPASASDSYNNASVLPNNGDRVPKCEPGIMHHLAPTSSLMGLRTPVGTSSQIEKKRKLLVVPIIGKEVDSICQRPWQFGQYQPDADT